MTWVSCSSKNNFKLSTERKSITKRTVLQKNQNLEFPFEDSIILNKMCDETKFSVMCSLFNWMQKSKSSAKKRSKFRKFLDNFCKPGDYFNAIRLLLPSLDRERGSYGLKESVLATCLVDAVGMSRESEDALRLFNWRKGGAKAGSNAGNFALVAAEVFFFPSFLIIIYLLVLLNVT